MKINGSVKAKTAVLVVVCLFQIPIGSAWLLPSHQYQSTTPPPSLSLKRESSSGRPTTTTQLAMASVTRQQFCSLAVGASLVLPIIATPSSKDVANAMDIDRKTGIALPEVGEVEAGIPTDWNDVDNPFTEDGTASFGRLDSAPDSLFYTDPRFVEHVDEQTVKSMTAYISNDAIPKNGDDIRVLDLCSSWTSHIDLSNNNSASNKKPSRISGLGMNAEELARNPVLDDWVVNDLNDKPMLPYDDNTYDVVLCQLSIDYLTKPLEVMKEVGRVLRPNGKVHILFSNRLFLSKAVALWTGADDVDHAYTVACYLHFCNGGLGNIRAKDLSTRKGRDKRIMGDPLYVVTATKSR